MATKTIQTRIKNRFDTLTEWSKDGVTLLQGEIALVSVTTQQVDQATGNVVNVPAVLMKVGANYPEGHEKAGTAKPFSELPWLSATAADVYDWAKAEDPSSISVKYSTGENSWTTSTLADILKDLEEAKADIAGLPAAILGSISVDPAAAADGVVHGITYNSATGKFSVSYGAVATADIAAAAVTTAKIADANVTTDKIADAAVTNAKIASGVSTDKISVDASTTLTDKLSTIDATLANKSDKDHTHDGYVNQNAFSNIKVGNTTVVADTTTDTVEFVGSANLTITPDATNDKITFTVEPAKAGVAGVVKLGETGGAATYDSIFGSDGNGGINAQVAQNTSDIAGLKSSVAGGIHFVGTVNAIPTSTTLKIDEHDVTVGDVVIYKGAADTDYKEYICTAVTAESATWEPLGDITRIGALETKLDNLDYAGGAFATSKFVTKVTQTDGVIAAEYAQPTSADVTHGDSTVKVALENLDANKAEKADTYTKNEVDKAVSDAKTEAATDASNKVAVALAESQTYADGLNTAMDERVDALEQARETSDADLADIKGNYIRYSKIGDTDTYHMHLSTDTDYIIFDCGGAQ